MRSIALDLLAYLRPDDRRRNHNATFAHFSFSENASFSRNIHEYYASDINQASYFLIS